MSSFLKKYWGLCLLALCCLIAFIWFFPIWYVNKNFISPQGKEKFEAIKDLRSTFINIGAGILAIIGLYLTWRRTKALDEQNLNTKEQIRILDNKNHNDVEANENNLLLQQFSEASELLANDKSIAARLSGIYLFEKIMNTSKDYHWQVIELLTAYVSEKRDNSKFDY